MALQLSVAVRNAQADAMESTTGTAPTLSIFPGSLPANCAAANTGTALVDITLPSDWMAAASGGAKALAGTWAANATATGTATHFRISKSGTVHLQGTVTATGGGGDITLSSVVVGSVGQQVAITGFTYTQGNA